MSNEQMRDPCKESTELSILWSLDSPTLTCGHEHWVVTERIRSGIDAAVLNMDSAWVQPERYGKELRHPSECLHHVFLWRCLGASLIFLPEQRVMVACDRSKQMPRSRGRPNKRNPIHLFITNHNRNWSMMHSI